MSTRDVNDARVRLAAVDRNRRDGDLNRSRPVRPSSMNLPQRLPSSRRDLTLSERRLIRAKIRYYGRLASRTSRAGLLTGGLLTVVLWLLTVAASDAPLMVVTSFWILVGGGITFWTLRDLRSGRLHVSALVEGLESSLRRNTADVYDVRATSFAEFDEVEDEGACYAFEIEGGRVVFIAGQEFYEGARFPSLDFSLVYALDVKSNTADMFIQKRGSKAAPRQRIASAIKARLELPDHLEVRTGQLDDVLRNLETRSAE